MSAAVETIQKSDEVLYEVSDAIATLTLNRPERLNTISGPMLARLTQLLIKANEDPEVRVIVLTGTGLKATPRIADLLGVAI